MLKRIIYLLVAVALVSTPAFAGNRPELDAVGCDPVNVFTWGDPEWRVMLNALDTNVPPNMINLYSDFPELYADPEETELIYDPFEFFSTTAGQLYPDPCFPRALSALTDPYNEAIYEWQIVLQMKPESDINVNIIDCVLKHNEWDWTTAAEQTGRYRGPTGQLFFVPTANPIITVTALPGKYATPGFCCPFIMDARTMPGLYGQPLNDACYTSKALWDESIVMELPETGKTNQSGESVYNLKQGDAFNIKVRIPGVNTCDIRYGPDNILLKYIGIVGTEYQAQELCLEM